MTLPSRRFIEEEVSIPVGQISLDGSLLVPRGAEGIVVFAHGSGSSRFSPRNRYVAGELQDANLATLLIDLLTRDEEAEDIQTGHLRFDICLLARRLLGAAKWVSRDADTRELRIGYFGASTGAAAALIAAAEEPALVGAVVSRGGRPDLAGEALRKVQAPTLLIVGSFDIPVIGMNRDAFARIHAPKELAIVPRASHLFEEPGALERVAILAKDWFNKHLVSTTQHII